MDSTKHLILTLFKLIMLITILFGMISSVSGQSFETIIVDTEENNHPAYDPKDSSDLTEDPWTYRIEGDHAVLVSYTPSEENDEEIVVIPEQLGGMPVTELGEEVFQNNKKIMELTIPRTVTYLNRYALNRSSIRKLTLDCNLDANRLTADHIQMIPNSVTTLVLGKDTETLLSYEDGNTFYWLDGRYLQRYEVDQNNPYYTAVDGILYSKDMTKLIRSPRENKTGVITIPEGVTEIGPDAFAYAVYMTEIS